MFARTAFILLYFTACLAYGIESNHLSKSGKISLKINLDALETEKISLVLNQNKIFGDLHVFHSNVYDDDTYKDVIKGHFMLQNLTDHKAKIKYQIIYKDKEGIVAKTTGDIHLPKGKNEYISCSAIPLSISEIKSINSYEIKLTSSK